MKSETFFENFDKFASAPNAVAKMRGLVLQLAMQGKLSTAHNCDIPVSDLMCAIEKEKEKRGIKDYTKFSNDYAESLNAELSISIPARWKLVRFGDIALHNAGKTLDKGRNSGELRDYITTSNLYWGFFRLKEVRQMPIQEDELERCTAIKGDLLICEGGEAGRAAVWPHDYEISFQNHVHRARFYGDVNPYFVQRFFEMLNATGEIEKFRKGVGISNMSGKALASIVLPLPPLAEQKRIVAKVNELMALCDRLETQQQERETRHAALASASLTRFSEAPTPANLDFLFHDAYPIAPTDLRKAILTLAIQGKITAPIDTDDSVDALLRAIHQEKERLVSNGFLRKVDPFGSHTITSCDGSRQWKMVPLAAVCISVTDGDHLPPPKAESGVPFLVISNVRWFGIDFGGCRHVSDEYFKKLDWIKKPKKDDILYTLVGSFGIPVVVTDTRPFCVQRHIGILRPSKHVDHRYIAYALTSEFVFEQATTIATGIAQKTVPLAGLRKITIPLPPLAEQRRIVAKVDQLMALVDQLEVQLDQSRATAEKLMAAVVGELTAQH